MVRLPPEQQSAESAREVLAQPLGTPGAAEPECSVLTGVRGTRLLTPVTACDGDAELAPCSWPLARPVGKVSSPSLARFLVRLFAHVGGEE